MYIEDTDHMLNFTYEKPSAEIIEKSKVKRVALLAKVEERKGRIKRLRDEYDVTDEVLIDLLQQARAQSRNNPALQYTSNAKVAKMRGGKMTEESVTVPAGVVNHLNTEQDLADSEIAEVKKLDLVVRNLVDFPDERQGQSGKMRGHRLNTDELVYLGF
jgi:hypothetical protein